MEVSSSSTTLVTTCQSTTHHHPPHLKIWTFNAAVRTSKLVIRLPVFPGGVGMFIAARVAAIAWSMAEGAFEFLFAAVEGGGVPWRGAGTTAELAAGAATVETGTVPGITGTGGKLIPGLSWLGPPDDTTDGNGVTCMGWGNAGLDRGTGILKQKQKINM